MSLFLRKVHASGLTCDDIQILRPGEFEALHELSQWTHHTRTCGNGPTSMWEELEEQNRGPGSQWAYGSCESYNTCRSVAFHCFRCPLMMLYGMYAPSLAWCFLSEEARIVKVHFIFGIRPSTHSESYSYFHFRLFKISSENYSWSESDMCIYVG